MNNKSLAILFTVGAAFVRSVGWAQDLDSLQTLDASSKNLFGISYRMGLNITASFKQLGGYAAVNSAANSRPLKLTTNGLPYNYDNGFILPVDPSVPLPPGFTFNYGYERGTPWTGTDFNLYRASSPGDSGSSADNHDIRHGLEINYLRRIGQIGHARWGLAAALGFADLSASESQTFKGAAQVQTDTFSTPAVGSLPTPPYLNGNAFLPDPNGAPVVSLAPTASTINSYSDAALVSGHQQLNARFLSLRLGPALELPVTKRLTFSLDGGLALLFVNSDFEFDETVTIDPARTPGVVLPPENHHGSGSHNGVRAGGYVGGTVSYALNERLRLFTGAQFQTTPDYSHVESGREAVLKLGQSVFVNFGASLSF